MEVFFMNQNNVSLGRVTRKRMHEYYKNFVSDPDIFMDMSKYFEYQYSPERIDRYWETRKKPKDRKDFFVLLESEVIGELALKHIDFEKKNASYQFICKMILSRIRDMGPQQNDLP